MNRPMVVYAAAAAVMLSSLPQRAAAVAPTADELAEARQWAAAKFGGMEGKPEVGLQVLANLNAVQLNARIGRPLQIVDKQFTRGLYCHAVSQVVVRLPGPGKTFHAVVGVDSNEQTRPGRGSVVFSVTVGEKNVFKSPLMREGMPGVPVAAALGGATEFVLDVTDGGDGIGCDQADWADARVTLADGKDVWLGDMKIAGGQYDARPFFSFRYDGQPSTRFLKTWLVERHAQELDAHRTQYTTTYRDPKTGLVVRCVGVAWQDYPTVEWTLYLKNEGAADTPLLESIQALDTTFQRGAEGEFVLHHNIGDKCTLDSFSPLETLLGANVTREFAPPGGRPTETQWPYYNLECPREGRGMLLAIGWPGRWAAKFQRDAGAQIRVVAGQETTHFKLHPGEEVRTPLVVLQFYKGDWLRGQNVWRRWMFAHNFPKDHGKPLAPKLGAASVQYYGFNCNQRGDIEFIDHFLQERIGLDYWWMDAGWYQNDGAGWPKVGTWEVDRQRFPGGIKAVSDHCHAHGIEVIVWFEPERVAAGTWLAENHPEWILGGKAGGLLNLGNPHAWKWLIDHFDKLITEQGVDLYRQDFNMDPLGCWRGNDAPDRQGITEIKHVVGYLAYWDELQRRHPGMLIDSCASGGRRNDLETMRRAVPLLRSDFEGHTEGNQCHTFGYALWLPYFNGVHNWRTDSYNFRCSIAPFVQRNWDVRSKQFDHALARKFLTEWRSVVDYYFGDFYPLNGFSTADNVWMVWEFNRADLRAGLVQAFRRPNCPYVSAQFKLRDLEPDEHYVVSSRDTEQTVQRTGRELMETGLLVTISEKPGAVLITYRKAAQ
jgi:alpha-galactosidase